jgi:hypothetical protein
MGLCSKRKPSGTIMENFEDRKYTNRLIAFIDILGFSQMVATSELSTDSVNRIYKTLTQMDKYTGSFLENAILDVETKIVDPQFTVFSDSIVVSCSDIETNYELFFNYLATLSYTMIESGILIRGGVTLGPVIHEKRLLFGSGMINAYKLESKLAIYPRIIIDDKLVETVLNMPDRWWNRDGVKVKGVDAKGHIRRDFDGMWCIDFLRMWWISDVDYARQWIKEHIGNIISNAPLDQTVQSKIRWLKNYASESAVATSREFQIKIRDPFEKNDEM